MSKPLENYIIRIKSSIDQFDNEGVIREEDRDHIELMTRGSFTKKNGSYYISYKETQTIVFFYFYFAPLYTALGLCAEVESSPVAVTGTNIDFFQAINRIALLIK